MKSNIPIMKGYTRTVAHFHGDERGILSALMGHNVFQYSNIHEYGWNTEWAMTWWVVVFTLPMGNSWPGKSLFKDSSGLDKFYLCLSTVHPSVSILHILGKAGRNAIAIGLRSDQKTLWSQFLFQLRLMSPPILAGKQDMRILVGYGCQNMIQNPDLNAVRPTGKSHVPEKLTRNQSKRFKMCTVKLTMKTFSICSHIFFTFIVLYHSFGGPSASTMPVFKGSNIRHLE